MLFLVVYRNVALLVDVRHHNEDDVFWMRELVETFTSDQLAEEIAQANARGLGNSMLVVRNALEAYRAANLTATGSVAVNALGCRLGCCSTHASRYKSTETTDSSMWSPLIFRYRVAQACEVSSHPMGLRAWSGLLITNNW